ncbi:hypothetical protein BN1723_008692 [Verticillium longisporum]|uniref:Nephrocystin 3-like N-terminal domain-containing protein n=1 Tax=Verticillium longisporum TaxID=100787 RepID=A0A0G4KHY6_VERLO|nr:hypothetical protein BN1723_008692 [Verticillium longisporum]CRK26122.1 hypothetical protein BN1708_004135 [Verticillium longisporum]
MPSLGLETVYPAPGSTPSPRWRRTVDIVCVHGFGRNPLQTWYHDVAGKTWVAETDFLGSLADNARVMLYTYNADLAANMNAASIAMHATELIGLINSCCSDTGGGPFIFVAHGFGGLIIKKVALALCLLNPSFPNHKSIRATAAGIIFLGTPHIIDSEPLLSCVKTTVLLHARQSSRIMTNEIKEYVESAKAVNLSFTAGLTRELEIVNFTEGITTNIAPDDEPAYMTNVIPKASSALGMGQGITEIMECTHEQMTRHCVQTSHVAITTDAQITPPKVAGVDTAWIEADKPWLVNEQRLTFMTWLKGWTEDNLGNHIAPALRTRHWFLFNIAFKNWMSSPSSSALFITGETGTGKTYLAKTIVNHLITAQPPENPTMAFFCNTHTSHATQPAILDYFIYDLLCRKPEWFDGVPPRYGNRQPPGSRFSHDTLFDILRGIKSTKLSMNTVYFIVDGLDLCEPSFVEQFVQQISSLIGKLIIEGIDQTPLPGQVEPPRPRFKFLLTMNPNRVPRQTSGFRHVQLAPAVVKANIAEYVDEFFERFTGIIPSQIIRKKRNWVKDESDNFFVAAASHCAELERAEDCRRGGFESYDDICPPPISQYYDHELFPILQDTSSNNYALLLLMLHISALGPLNMTEMLDAISCLYDDSDVKDMTPWSLLGGCISRIVPCHGLGFRPIHRSLITYVERFVTRQEQHANMAAICLRYLSRPEFNSPFSIYDRPRPEAQAFLNTKYPFYSYAATRWARHIARSETKGLKLLSKLQDFVSDRSQTFQTWCHYKAWSENESESCAGHRVPPCIEMAKEDARIMVRHFLSSVQTQTVLDKIMDRMLLFGMIGLPKNMLEFAIPTSKKRFSTTDDLQDYHGLNMLHHACREGHIQMVELVLECTQDINRRARGTGETALLIACQGSHRTLAADNDSRSLEIADILLQAGANPNIPSYTGNTCLHNAGRSNHPRLVQKLLQYGALPNVSDVEGITVLESAAVLGADVKAVELLIDAGADTSVWCQDKRSPISNAIVRKDFDMFKILLRGISDINMIDGNGVGILHHQLILERPEWLACLLERPGVNLDLMPLKDGELGVPPLAFAAGHGYSISAEMLLAAGATPGYVPGQAELLPLHYAIQAEGAGDASMTRLLLEYGAPLNTLEIHAGWGRRSALSRAVSTKNESIVRMLLDYGADPTMEEGCGDRGPLHLAVKRNCPAIVRMLMEHPLPPDPNYVPENGVHVLIQAVQPGNGAEMTKLLLEYGADTQIFHRPAQAESPLHYAAGDGMADVCQALLDHDPAMINLQDDGSLLIDTPLHRAARAAKPQETIACLLAAGARPEAQAYLFMDIPLHQACQKANLEAVKVLHAAAPELINSQDFFGHTPLIDACREGAVAVVEFLLHNGADIGQRDHLGHSCISRVVDQEPGIALRLIRLLLNHGLGINDVVACDGFTVLAEACVAQNMPLVEYLLEKGADPIRCQRGPDGTSWRTAVHLVMQRRKPKALDVLLERQDVRDHMKALDWAGRTVIHCSLRHPTTQLMVSKLYWASGAVEASDFFTDLINVRDRFGLKPFDYTHPCVRKNPAPGTIRWLDRTIHASILMVVYTHRTLRDHQAAMLDMIDLLLFRGGYDKHTITLFHRLALRVDIVEKDDKYEKNTYYGWTCDCCDKVMSVAAKHCMKVCRVCQVSLCDDPECWDVWEPQVHAWITVPFIQDTDLNSREMQQTLEDLLYAFDPAQDEKRSEARVTTEVGLPSDPESDTTTLSLAVLHAFGLLEIPRKAWSPFLPLPPRLFARLASWDWMLLPTRKRFEQGVWAAELKPHRLKLELDYFLISGRRIALPNEKLTLSQAVLESLATLFEAQDMPERARQRPRKRYTPRHQLSPDMGPPPPPLIHPRLQTHEPISRWASPLPVTLTPTSPRSVRSFSSVSSFVRD